jgi:hypothetical protein
MGRLQDMQLETKRPAAVTQAPDGTWQVTAPDGAVLATCVTNAEAWKAYDRLADQPLIHSFREVCYVYSGSASLGL